MPCRFPPLFPFCQACALVIAGGLFGADESTESCSSEDFTAPSFSFVFSSRPFPFSTTFPLQCVSFCFVLFFHIYLTLSSSAFSRVLRCPGQLSATVLISYVLFIWLEFLCSILMISCLPLSFHWLSWPSSPHWQQWKSYSIWWLLNNFGFCEKLGSVLHFCPFMFRGLYI